MKTALARINVPVLLLSSSTDRTVPAYLTDELEHNLSNVKRVVFENRNGHLGYLQPAGTSEYQQIGGTTKTFIESIPD
jgi:homoserine acetyltransferase